MTKAEAVILSAALNDPQRPRRTLERRLFIVSNEYRTAALYQGWLRENHVDEYESYGKVTIVTHHDGLRGLDPERNDFAYVYTPNSFNDPKREGLRWLKHRGANVDYVNLDDVYGVDRG